MFFENITLPEITKYFLMNAYDIADSSTKKKLWKLMNDNDDCVKKGRMIVL